MNNWIILLRGINVGGHNILPMKELRGLLAGLGYENVQTYIQSGNAMIQNNHDNPMIISAAVADVIEKKFDFIPSVLTLGMNNLQQAIENNPFESSDLSKIHFYFLDQKPSCPDFSAIKAIQKESEDYRLVDTLFYLHAPEGIGRSKLAAKAETLLGVSATARNLRTVQKLMSMIN